MKNLTNKLSIITLCIAIFSIAISGCEKDKTNPIPDPTTVTDVDGNVYNVVRIGTQLWTVENLRTTKYNDGTMITTGLSNSSWQAATSGAYAIFEDDNTNDAIYGKLYNWYAVSTSKLAPKGWHIPSNAEWDVLVKELGGSQVAGGKMKTTSTLWEAPNLGADNSSKFSAVPSGYKGPSANYELLGRAAYWWASTPRNASQADYLNVDKNLAGAASNAANKTFGYAVRCIKD